MTPPTAAPTRPISAVIITRDAATHLAAVLDSARDCAELLVVDSGSTDDTVAIARAAGARVEHQPFLGYGPQKRRAVELARHDWILSLDADEILDAEAQAAIRDVVLDDPRGCWWFRRRTFIGRREVLHGPWGHDRVVRLFNRTTATFKPLEVHEEVMPGGPSRPLAGSILHYSYVDCADVIARSLRYAPLKAAVMRRIGQRTSVWTLPWRGLAAFVRSYAWRGGWRDGALGFVIAVARMVDSTLPRAMLLFDERDPDAAAPPAAERPVRSA